MVSPLVPEVVKVLPASPVQLTKVCPSSDNGAVSLIDWPLATSVWRVPPAFWVTVPVPVVLAPVQLLDAVYLVYVTGPNDHVPRARQAYGTETLVPVRKCGGCRP